MIDKYGSKAFQYDPTEGFGPLRETLVDYLRQKGIQSEMEEILVASGSQGVLDALGKVLISKGDTVAVEAPTYLGALQAFTPYEPEYARLETDDKGLIPESLEKVLDRGGIKFIYLVPTFQNPTGRTIPLERRKDIAAIIRKYNALLIEDDPYGSLRYRGTDVPTLKSLAPDNVVYISTLSKVFAPGLRIGFCVAPEQIRKWLVIVKQGTDLHSSTFNQALAAEYIAGGFLAKHLPNIINLYRLIPYWCYPVATGNSLSYAVDIKSSGGVCHYDRIRLTDSSQTSLWLSIRKFNLAVRQHIQYQGFPI